MIQVISEFVIKQDAQGPFELAFGPGGAWSNLFASSPGFRGTIVLRDTKDRLRYLKIDLWETTAQREQMLAALVDEHTRLEAALRDWTESKTELGSFRALAEATVRPHVKSGRSKAGGPGPGSRRSAG